MENKYKGIVATTGIAALIGIGAFYSFDRRTEPEQIPAPTQFEPIRELVIPTASGDVIYIVRPGDSLSEIVHRELGMRNTDSIYDKVFEIQRRNLSLTADRDIYYMENEVLLPGPDGLVDIIYPLEEFDGIAR